VAFTNEDSHVISIGTVDRTILQWKHTPDDVIDDADVVDEAESDDYVLMLRDGSDYDEPPELAVRFPLAAPAKRGNVRVPPGRSRPRRRSARAAGGFAREAELKRRGGGALARDDRRADEGTHCAPLWPCHGVTIILLRVRRRRSQVPTGDPRAPLNRVELQFVHGFRCHDTKANVRYTSEQKVVFPASQVVVRMDPFTWAQVCRCVAAAAAAAAAAARVIA
jgi:hypothetical protein